MTIFIIGLLVQAGLVVHCIKTGRNTIWIWVLILLPGAGALAYVAVELLPELLRSRGARSAVRGVKRAMDPEQDLRRAEQKVKLAGDVHSRQHYAAELIRMGRPAEAVDVCRSMLTGIYDKDPTLMLGLAQAQFAADDFAGCRETLDSLIRDNPSFQSPDGHLLYARATEGAGDIAKALAEYQVLAGYYPGAEATVRYARLLHQQGRADEARKLLRGLLERAAMAPAYYKKMQKEWLDEARREC